MAIEPRMFHLDPEEVKFLGIDDTNLSYNYESHDSGLDLNDLEKELSEFITTPDKYQWFVMSKVFSVDWETAGPKFWALAYRRYPELKEFHDKLRADKGFDHNVYYETNVANLTPDNLSGVFNHLRKLQDTYPKVPDVGYPDKDVFIGFRYGPGGGYDPDLGYGSMSFSVSGFNAIMPEPISRAKDVDTFLCVREDFLLHTNTDITCRAELVLIDSLYNSSIRLASDSKDQRVRVIFGIAENGCLNVNSNSCLNITGSERWSTFEVSNFDPEVSRYEGYGFRGLPYDSDEEAPLVSSRMDITGTVDVHDSSVRGFGSLEDVTLDHSIIDNSESLDSFNLSRVSLKNSMIFDSRSVVGHDYFASNDNHYDDDVYWYESERTETAPEYEIRISAPEGETIDLENVCLYFAGDDLGMDVRKQSDIQVFKHPTKSYSQCVMYRAGNGEVRFQESTPYGIEDLEEAFIRDVGDRDEATWQLNNAPLGYARHVYHNIYEVNNYCGSTPSLTPPEWAYEQVREHVHEIDPNYDLSLLGGTEQVHEISAAKQKALSIIGQYGGLDDATEHDQEMELS